LAQALEASGDYSQAQSYLLNLLSESPGSGEINLALARIAAKNKSMTDAMRYYDSAIYGVWETDPLGTRWDVRYELCEYLLDQNDGTEAQPELIALAQETPARDPVRENRAGELLLRASLWNLALTQFQAVLASDHRDANALTGAGKAAFELARYPEAIDDLDRLPDQNRADPGVADMIDTAREIESASIYLPGISIQEKAKRAANALADSTSRVEDCARQRGESLTATPPVTPLQTLFVTAQKMKADWSGPNLERHPEFLDAAMSLAFQMENTAAQECGVPGPGPDSALLMISRNRAGASQ
jgi:tetratricopeptide (TPR) repeat protein